MNKKSFWRMSRYKQLSLMLAILGSGGYFLTPANIASAAGQFGYDDEEFPPQYLDMDQFVITADRTPVNKWTTPANVIVITDKDIEANHYQTLSEALNHVNGIIVPVGINVPIINGFEKVLILVDGHQLYNDGVGFRDTVELSAIPSMKNIKRIEIVKGGGSALYGSDAVTGIINIITKKGEDNETTLDFNAGSWHQRNYELTNQGVRGDFSWFITGGVHESNPFDYAGGGERANDQDSRESDKSDKDFTARFDYRFDERNSLTLSGAHISHRYNRAFEYKDSASNLYDSSDRHKEMTYNNVLLVYNFKENTQAPGWLRYFYDYKVREGYEGRKNTDLQSIRYDEISKFRVQGVDYQNSWILGQNKIVTGVEWHQISMDHWSWEGTQKLSNRAFYLQDTISLGQKWKLIPGFRYDHNSEFGHQWSPKIAANYRADELTKIYASWGRVYKAATPYQLYVNQSNRHGNANLRPERGNTAILGMEHDFDSQSILDVNVFYANLKDAIDYPDGSTQFVNVNNQKSRGFEVTFKQQINEDWSYDVGYNYTKVEGFDTVGGSFIQPRNTYRVGFHYNHGIWQANLLGIIGHGGLSANSFDATKYAVFDFNINCNVHENATVYLKLNNLTNQNYSYYSKNGDSVYHSPGRSIIAGVDFSF